MTVEKLEERALLSVLGGPIRAIGTLPQAIVAAPIVSNSSAPTAPTSLALVSRTDTAVTIRWGPSTDDLGVTGYEIFRNGTLVGTTNQNQRTFTDTGLKPNTVFSFAVRALDADGNRSPFVTVLVRTSPASGAAASGGE